jgi:hypothetical protein
LRTFSKPIIESAFGPHVRIDLPPTLVPRQ